MPSRFTVKQLVENGYYHVYNRGVEKRNIFCTKSDYKYFLFLLKSYLTSPDELEKTKKGLNPQQKLSTLQRGRYESEIDLLAYALMPNHFHLLLQQRSKEGLSGFMKSVSNNYTSYFNKRYDRVGPLFQGRYKGVLVKSDEYLIHLSRYIHLNPRAEKEKNRNPLQGFTSYEDYLGTRSTDWLKADIVLKMFLDPENLTIEKHASYREFVENYNAERIVRDCLGNLIIESL